MLLYAGACVLVCYNKVWSVPRGLCKRCGRFSGGPTEIQTVLISVTGTLEWYIFVHGAPIVGIKFDHYQTMDEIP